MKSRAGFTLIELLVVLVLMSMMAAVTGPSLWNSYLSRQEQSDLDLVVGRIHELRRDYRKRGQVLILNQDDYSTDGLVVLPQEWKLLSAQQLRFLSNGVTNGGELFLQSVRGNAWRIWFHPLDGKVEIHKSSELP